MWDPVFWKKLNFIFRLRFTPRALSRIETRAKSPIGKKKKKEKEERGEVKRSTRCKTKSNEEKILATWMQNCSTSNEIEFQSLSIFLFLFRPFFLHDEGSAA